MENKFAEPAKKEPTVLRRVRDRVVALHDKHLKVTPLSEHILERFNALAPDVSSQKGKKLVEWLRPRIVDLAKNAEVATAVADVAIGVVAAGVALEGGARVASIAIDNKKKILSVDKSLRHQTAGLINNESIVRAQKPFIRGAGGAVTSGVFLGLRPITRWVDGILLRLS